MHHENKAYEFDSGDYNYINARELKPTVPLKEWYLTANAMFEEHHHAFTNDVSLTHQKEFIHSRDSTLNVTIGSTGSNHAHGKIEEFMYLIGTYSSEYHITYSRMLYRTGEATTSSPIQDANVFTPVNIIVHTIEFESGDVIGEARVLVVDESGTTLGNVETDASGIANIPYLHTCDITITGKARKATGEYFKPTKFQGIVTERGEELYVFLKRD